MSFSASCIPAVYYPTCVMLVDDSRSFLQNLSLNLDEDIPFLIRTNPHLIKDELVNSTPLNYNNLEDLKKLLLNPRRFDWINVLVIDRSMPEFDGLHFCAELRDYPIRRILLTGMADSGLAIKAMRDEMMDAYLSKADHSVLDKMNVSIKELSAHQFRESYGEKIKSLGEKASVLERPECIKFFKDLCEHYNIVEFYLIDNALHFLLLDQQARAYLLLIQAEHEVIHLESNALFNVPQALLNTEALIGTAYRFVCMPVTLKITPPSFERYKLEIWKPSN